MLILRKIIKIVATRCQILRLKCTKFDYGWGSARDPTGGAYSAAQTPSLLVRGEGIAKGRRGEGRGRREREGRKGEGRGEGRNAFPHLFNPTLTTACTTPERPSPKV